MDKFDPTLIVCMLAGPVEADDWYVGSDIYWLAMLRRVDSIFALVQNEAEPELLF